MKKQNTAAWFARSLRTGFLCVCFLAISQLLGGCGAKGEILSRLRAETARQDGNGISENGIDAPRSGDAGEDGSQGDAIGNSKGDALGMEGEPAVIYVHVCGAVKNPGVYELPAGSRNYEAVEAAGGFAEDACEDYLNMAAVLADGSRLEIPTMEEAETMEESVRPAEASDGKVNINTADIEKLCTLPGVGEGRAKAIIEYREKQGGFRKKEDIMQVSGIGEKMFERMEAYLKVE